MNAPQTRAQAPVDVLAVMRQLAGLAFVSGADEGPAGNEPAYRLHQNAILAIDAVVALLDEVEERQIRLQGFAHFLRAHGHPVQAAEADNDATSLRAALARVKGGAA